MSIIDDATAIAQRLKEIQSERSREIAGKPDPVAATPTTVTGSGGWTNGYQGGVDPHVP